MLTALQIDQNLRHMVHFLETKKWEYVSVQLHHNNNNNKNDQYGEEENAEVVASLIQSTVMSFIATTATEIESLRGMVHTTPTTKATGQSLSNHLILHRSGIVQILLERLQREIAQPFGMLQKQRKRMAVRLWQNPLECRLAPPPAFSKRKTKRMNDKNGVDHDNNEDDDLEEELGRALGFSTSKASSNHSDYHQKVQQQFVQKQRFLPARPSHRFQQDFLETYNRSSSRSTYSHTKFPPSRPKSMLFDVARQQNHKKRDDLSSSPDEPQLAGAKRAKSGAVPQPPTTVPNSYQQQEDDHKMTATTYTDLHELEQEAQLLTVTMVNSDLDAVQQMEQRMTEITSLLSQFANLVTLQQDEVAVIHQDTAAAKANMEQGQDELVNAKEAVRASQHYMAKAITAMAVMLLIFHWMKA